MQRVNRNNSELKLWYLDSGGVPVYQYRGEPFTGIIEEYYDNNVLQSEEEYQNGYREGWIRSYYYNGNIDTEYQDHNNITVPGTYKEFDENGNLVHSM
ncbi:toxin-antitoxin system YwqK family antitoxin [Flavobacterium hauense]